MRSSAFAPLFVGAVLLTWMLLPTTHAADTPHPVKVFILAGQSNMQGQGVVSMDDPKNYNGGKGNLVWSMEHSASKDMMRHLRNADGSWAERDDVTIRYKVKDKVRQGKLTVGYTGYGGSSHIGPELEFGNVIGDFIDEPVLLIKTAWGGKSLYVDFRPPSAGGDTGPYYTQMIAEVREGLADLGDRPYELAGFVWMQGWNDMINKDATAEYAANLKHLIHDIRAEFKSPDLPVVVGELGNGGPAKPGTGMDTFRKAQRAGVEGVPHAKFVETQTCARPAEMSPNVGHGHHWFGNAESYFLVGDALGHGMIELLKK
ncbi:MAG: sialate O-acetylesterase [Phycisphaera sp.]|nr:sialate O-acetylesterase [Phycisphaera sp.]